jgi:tetratricopeptide (TPR) repeat protein
MLEVAVELGGSREEAELLRNAPRQAARWVWRHLDTAAYPWLLVIDNADQPAEIDPEHRPGEQRGWLRSSPKGLVLVTSRLDDPGLWAPAKVHRVGILEGADATAALADHAGAEHLPGAEELAERLGGVPLALFLAGRILATHHILFPDANSLLEHLDGDVARLDELSEPLLSGGDSERRLLSGVWDLSLRMVGEQNPQAVPLLRALALLGPQGQAVPLRRLPVSELVGGAVDVADQPLDEASFARAVNALIVHGLVQIELRFVGRGLRLHPLVSETVRSRLGESDRPLILEIEKLLAGQGDQHPRLERGAFAALGALARKVPSLGPEFKVRVGLAEARRHLQLGQFAEAERHAGATWSSAEETLGTEDPLTLQARHLCAEAWLFQDRVPEAEREYLLLLADKERLLGTEHPRTLDTRHQIALVAGMRGDWSLARQQHTEILKARLRTQGPEATETLASMDALGYAAFQEGDTDAAEPLFREVFETRRDLLGELHRLTLNAEYKLGLLALRRGDDDAARRIFASVLRSRSYHLGEAHPQTRLVRDRLSGVPREEPGAGGAVHSG